MTCEAWQRCGFPKHLGKKRKDVPSEAESKNPHIMETIKRLRNCKSKIMKFSLVFFIKYFFIERNFLKINYFGKVIWSKNIKFHTSAPSFPPRHCFSSFTWNPTAGLDRNEGEFSLKDDLHQYLCSWRGCLWTLPILIQKVSSRGQNNWKGMRDIEK